jgi:hypothetical protein
MSVKMDYEQAAEELHALIRECDADTLAAIYEQSFGAVESCEQSCEGDYFIATYHEGLEPKPFELSDFEFRKLFWSPFEQYKHLIGCEFKPVSVETLDQGDGPFPLFKIKFTYGEEIIDAWEEEVVTPSSIFVNDEHPPKDEELPKRGYWYDYLGR